MDNSSWNKDFLTEQDIILTFGRGDYINTCGE